MPETAREAPNGDDPLPSLHRHYPASTLLRSSPPLSGASVLSASRLEPLVPFPLASSARFSRRRALHAKIVNTIETRHPDRISEQLERLAHHALRAELWEKA